MLSLALFYVGFPDFEDEDTQNKQRLLYIWTVVAHSLLIIVMTLKKSYYVQFQKCNQVLTILAALHYFGFILICVKYGIGYGDEAAANVPGF